jgi:DNA-binding beta-propeller fold protein YncE
MFRMTLAVLATLGATSVAIAADSGNTAAGDSVLRHFALGGAGGWDDLSVDSAAHRLYLSRSDRVIVVDTTSGKTVGEIPNTNGVHGIALVPALHAAFSSNGKSDSLTAFDTTTLKPIAEVKVKGNNPDAILYDAASQRVIAFNGRSANASVVDPATRTEVGTIALDGKPEFARADGNGHVFVNIEDKGELSEIDPKSAKVLATWSLTGCEEPSGLALDLAHHRAFSVCQNGKMVVTDTVSGKHVADIAIGAGPDGAAFDAARALVFSPNGRDGTLTIVHEDDADHYSVVATVPTQKSARTIVLDEAAHRLYLPAAEFDPLPANAPPHTRPPMKPDTFVVLEVGESSGH